MKNKSHVYRSFAMIGQFGISILVPIFICSFIGYYIDQYFHTNIWFIVLFFLGAIAGFRNIYHFSKQIYEKKEDEDDYEHFRKDAEVYSKTQKQENKKRENTNVKVKKFRSNHVKENTKHK